MKHSEIINVVIIEDNKFIRDGWELVLQNEKDLQLISSYGSCEEAFKNDDIALADIVLMDIGLPGMSGIDGVKYLKEKFPKMIIIMFTVYEDDDKIFDALCAGAVGYLLKKTEPSLLASALRDAYHGGSPMTPSVARKIISTFQKINIKSFNGKNVELNERENQILTLMAKGKSYKEIADEIFLSIDGVTYHIRNIYEKLNVHSRSEAVAEGFKKRIIKPPTP